jgi:hypothetical protein
MPATSCPQCNQKLKVPDGTIGKKVKCSGCGHGFVIEAQSPKRTPEPAPPPLPPRSRPLAKVLQLGAAAILGAVLSGAAVHWRDSQPLDAMRKELADSQAEGEKLKSEEAHQAQLKAELLQTTEQLRDARGKIVQADAKVVAALEKQKEVQDGNVKLAEDNVKLAKAASDRAKQRDEIMQAHYGRLSDDDRATMNALARKAKEHTLTWQEFQVLERIAGGDLAYLGFPKLHEIRRETIRRAAKDDPSLEPTLRQLEPDAFTSDAGEK